MIAAQALFIPAKAQLAQALMEIAWRNTSGDGQAQRPWPWADFSPVARLGFPDGGHLLVLSDAGGESLAFGPTLVAGSVEPGEPGVAVLAAHRDTHFRGVDRLTAGDVLTLETGGKVRSFRVTGSEVVRWDASGIEPRDGGPPRIALVTCWPLDSQFRGPMRYVVWATASSI